MMAQPSYPASAPLVNPISVVGAQYCAPYPVDLTIMRKVMTITDGNFAVSDVNGNILFKVKGSFFTLHDKRVLLDAAGNPLLSMRQKVSIFIQSLIIVLILILTLLDFSSSLVAL
ncbi:Lurp-one-related [Thalictrum thalictroides]|uniref:Lurp-one-related n=1 Tax=Thalictrum thalictroides TaxID=46969 RepID=A0A7J6VWU8_THATH|nr:Lurp-one-related [Thalictrum thalictroides]